MRKLPFRIAITVVALTQSAFTCGPGVDPPGVECLSDAAPASEQIEIGTILNGAFVPADGTTEHALDRGPQGGQHIFVALRLYAMDGDAWVHEMSLRDGSGQEVGSPQSIDNISQ